MVKSKKWTHILCLQPLTVHSSSITYPDFPSKFNDENNTRPSNSAKSCEFADSYSTPICYTCKVNKQPPAGALICLSDILLKHCPDSQEQSPSKIRKRSPFVDNKRRDTGLLTLECKQGRESVPLLLLSLPLRLLVLPPHFTSKWLGNCVCLYKKSRHVAICFSTYSLDIS